MTETSPQNVPPLCVHELFELQARRSPRRIALSFNGEDVTYEDLNRRANLVAAHLQSLGVGPESLVGVIIDRSPELIVGLLAILKAGGAYVAVDPSYPRERIAFMLDDSQAPIVLVRRGEQTFSSSRRRIVDLDSIPRNADAESNRPRSGVTPENLAYVLYTSGSSGKPKGVQIEHRSLSNLLASMQQEPGLTEADTLLAVTSVSFDIAGLEIYLPLIVGGRLSLTGPSVARDGEALARALETSQATVIQATPTAFQMMVAAGWRGSPSLRVLCGGEPLSQKLASDLLARSGSLWNLYGPTETTIWSTLTRILSASDPITIGRPIANTEVYVATEARDTVTEVPTGTIGELCIGGLGVARGYLNQPALTAEKFVADPFRGGTARLYRTGDRARVLADGRIELLGRVDRQIKIRGTRVEPGEIEAVLAKHPAVRASVVLGHATPNGGTRLSAFLLLAEPSERESARDKTEKWQKVWSEVYRKAADVDDDALRIAGWNDSATGLPMSREEVEAWADATAARILELKPKRVLEIGCGNGLVLRRVAPACASYVGIDITEEAVAHVRRQLGDDARWRHVEVRQGTAEAIHALPPGQFDCIVINSVMQYFPDVAYAVRVLESALLKVEPGGTVFVGDVRSLPLLEAFHTSVELANADDSLPTSELYQRIREAVHRENELVIDPLLFDALASTSPNVTEVDLRYKRGGQSNELVRFRYDVALRSGAKGAGTYSDVVGERVDWVTSGASEEGLPLLLDGKGDRLVLTNVPNARVAGELAALDAMTSSRPPATTGGLKAARRDADRRAIAPEDFCKAIEALGFDVRLRPSADPSTFDAFLTRRAASTQASVSVPVGSSDPQRAARAWSSYANDPSRTTSGPHLSRSMRAFLRHHLPEGMIPSRFVAVDEMPRTPNGKLDVAALAALDVTSVRRAEAPLPPRDATERLLIEIWEDVLGVEGVGTGDDFRELGGDSLLAVEVVARLESALRRKLSLASVFGTHVVTVAKQAEVVRGHVQSVPNRVAIIPLRAEGSRPPLFFASTPMNLVRHIGADQPLYDVSIQTVHRETYVPDLVETTVDDCVEAIRRVQPRGPYFLGGHCFSGLLMLDVALRLQAMKQEVALLVLVDPDPEDDVPIAARISHHLREVKRLSVREKAAFLKEKTGSLLRTLREMVIRSGAGMEAADYGTLYNARWGNTQWTQPFPTALLLSRPKYDRQRDLTSAWERRALQELTIVDLPGDRTTAFSEPHVRVAAEKLTRCLELAQQASAATIPGGAVHHVAT